ncbi:thy-1 membrane glycoprotein [Hemicordylus capensis]|uniref:thy-1 membrane glycoprotein n=1 Tax=Hemicordylus capensis TaxID=884348 RepID=UPI0023031E6A|nr:thy-1 membrane glycoprotein [Hemicordylus capensis]
MEGGKGRSNGGLKQAGEGGKRRRGGCGKTTTTTTGLMVQGASSSSSSSLGCGTARRDAAAASSVVSSAAAVPAPRAPQLPQSPEAGGGGCCCCCWRRDCFHHPHAACTEGGKMKSTLHIVLLVTVLQLACCQNIRSLTACLSGQSLRLDCAYERKTRENPLLYEFRLSKDNRERRVVASTITVPDQIYKGRANVTTDISNLVRLHLNAFSSADEGNYACQLKITNDYTDRQTKNISVIKDQLERCAGISLLIQNTSWLLLLLLSLPLLQAVDAGVSL